MKREDILKLYEKERSYQDRVFGEANKSVTLNVASFMLFIEQYLKKAEQEYVEKWEAKKPKWFKNSPEYVIQGSAPIRTYEYLVKVMALAGAALETFAEIDPEHWREEGINKKWLDDGR